MGHFSFLTGCATRRLTQFNTFAQAGITYNTASQTVVTDAGNAVVNTDSALLIKSRPDLSEAQRRTRVTQSDELSRYMTELPRSVALCGGN